MINNPRHTLARILFEAIKKSNFVVSEKEVTESLDYCNPRFGEYSTNLVFRISKQESLSNEDVAKMILEQIKKHKDIDSADFVEPGFINVKMHNDVWKEFINSIDNQYLKTNMGKGKSSQIEFISANPTGPLVLTNAWQGYFGDILSRIYDSQGFSVSREYYLNDGGNQISSLGMAIQLNLGKEFDSETKENLYRGEYIAKVAEVIVAEHDGNQEVVLGSDPSVIGKRAAEIILEDYIKPDLSRLGVNFDSIYSETKPDIKKTLERLKDAGLIIQKDGAIWLDGSKAGLKQDEVLVRSYDNQYTYFLKDLAYQLERLEERGFDNTITIVGPDHHGQAIRLVNTLKLLGHETFKELSTQTIRLIKDGKEFKMSKRKGNYILLEEFLDMVPTEAARFYFAMRDTNTHMDFDINLVKEHSAKNPVYYSLYAYARACSIVEKSKESRVVPAKNIDNYELSKKEKALALEISKIPAILAEIVEKQKVHLLLHQTYEVAKAFHEYYESERVLDSDKVEQKIFFINKFKSAYEAIFEIIGVSLLEKM